MSSGPLQSSQRRPRKQRCSISTGALATGTGIFMAAILAGLVMGRSIGEARARLRAHVGARDASLLTISAMMALGFTTRYSGLDATLGLAFASTGMLYPFFGTMLGWLGVAHGIRHFIECIRKFAAHHGRTTRFESHSHGRRQQLGRCDGQDDRRAEHRRRQQRRRGGTATRATYCALFSGTASCSRVSWVCSCSCRRMSRRSAG